LRGFVTLRASGKSANVEDEVGLAGIEVGDRLFGCFAVEEDGFAHDLRVVAFLIFAL